MGNPSDNDMAQVTMSVRSYDLDTMGANHNAVIVYIGNEEAFAIHGFAIDRETGDMSGIGDTKNDTLRAMILPQHESALFDMPISGENVFFQGSLEDAAKKLASGLDAIKFINDQNLDYDPYVLIGTAQNSNSVAHTIVHAMGESFPKGAEEHWAPGHDRILVPEGWSSIYASPSTPVEAFRNALSGENILSLSGENVRNAAIGSTKADRDDIYFDRKNPFVPYEPLGGHVSVEPPPPPPPEADLNTQPVHVQPVDAPKI